MNFPGGVWIVETVSQLRHAPPCRQSRDGVFLSAGLPPDTAIQLFQIVYTYVLGHAQFYLCHRDANSFSQPESYQSLPNLSRLSPMEQRDSLDDFLLALELLISGLEQKLRKASQ